MQDQEIERQFRLLRPAAEIIAQAERDRTLTLSYDIHQSYLPDTGKWTVRARKIIFDAPQLPAYEQTLKRTIGGITRRELPINLDVEGYARLARECGPVLRKRRTEIHVLGRKWEIDVFLNPSILGLELVEVELPAEDAELRLPDWVGAETTHDRRFRNAAIAALLPSDD